MKQDLATAYRQNEEPKYQNKKESLKADSRSKTCKRKNNVCGYCFYSGKREEHL